MRQVIRRLQVSLSVLLIVSLLSSGVLLPTRVWAAVSELAELKGPTKVDPPGPEYRFEQRLKQLKERLRREADARGAGRQPDPDLLAEELRAARADLAALDAEMRALLSGNEQSLQEGGAPPIALERHRQFVAEYEAQLALLQQELTHTEEAPGDAVRQENLLKKLRDFTPKDRQQPLGSSLPFRSPEPAAQELTLTAAAAMLPEEPTPADHAQTLETLPSAAIQQLAADLGNDPVALYEWVRNNIRYSPYGGSRKGAARTLEERAGNAWDQSSLLIALLRAAGYPARYVTGTIQVPSEAAMAWTGTANVRSAVQLLASGGVPVSGITSGGDYAAVQMAHTWVEAFVPLDDYRGIAGAAAESAWQPFDPSYKATNLESGVDLPAVSGLDPAALLEQLSATADSHPGTGGTTSLDAAYVAQQIDAAYRQAEQYLLSQGYDLEHPERYVEQLVITPESLGIAPLTMPYDTVATIGEYSEVPEAVRERVAFGLSGASFLGATLPAQQLWSAPTAELAGKRLTLSWRPATADDEAILAKYGGFLKTPAYLVKVTPELKLEGQVVATGPSLGLGQQQTFTMWFQAPGGRTIPVENSVVAGSYYAVALDLGFGSTEAMTRRADLLQQVSATLTEQNVWSDEAVGEMLHMLGQGYFGQVGAIRALLARSADIAEARHTSAGLVAADLSAAYLFFSPVSVRLGGLHIDVDHDLVSPVSRTGDSQAVRGYMVASGAVGSAYEHLIFEQMLQVPALSAMRVFQVAQERGIPIYTINASNVEELLPLLDLSDAVESDIRSSAMAGKLVFAPEREVQLYNWHGAGYVVMDPESGAAGYMISGGWAGGSTDWEMLLVTLVALIGLLLMAVPFVNAIVGLGLFIFGPLTLGTVFGALINLFIIASTLWYAYELFDSGYDYWVNHDDAAGRTLVGLAAGTLFGLAAGALVGKAIGAVAQKYPAVGRLVEKAFTWLDDVTYGEASRLVTRGWTREIVVMAAETGGPGSLKMLTQLGDEGLITFSEMAELISRGIAPHDINLLVRAGIRDLAAVGINTADDAARVANLIKNGFSATDVEYLAVRGINASNLEQHGIFGLDDAQRATAFLRGGASADDLRVLGRTGLKVTEYASAGISSVDDVAAGARLVKDFGFDKAWLQRGARVVEGGTASVLDDIQRAFPDKSLKNVLTSIDDLAQKYGAEVHRFGDDVAHALPDDLAAKLPSLVDRRFTPDQVRTVMPSANSQPNLQGAVGELQAYNVSTRHMNLTAQRPGPVLKVGADEFRVDVVAHTADNKVIVFEARNYKQASFDTWKNNTSAFEEQMTRDFERFAAARDYYQGLGKTDIPTYFFADNTWDPAIGRMISEWYNGNGWTVNIIRYR